MSTIPYSTTWQNLQETFEAVAARGQDPIILSSLPYTPEGDHQHTRFSLIVGPPGRLIAIAIGLRAVLPDQPLILVGAADTVTIGTNHLLHAARRNIGMTLLLLRSDFLPKDDRHLDRAGLTGSSTSMSLESDATPLEWATAMRASFVARASIHEPAAIAQLIAQSVDGGGFSVIGLTADSTLPFGVLSRCEWPEYFSSYREIMEPLAGTRRAYEAVLKMTPRPEAPKRVEVRIAGIGGQGVKLAGTILSEAAGFREGLWATHYGVYGSATRGGPSMVDIVMGSERITYAGADRPDVLVLLSQAAADANLGSVHPGTRIVVEQGAIEPVPQGAIEVPIVRLAREHTGKAVSAGVTALGCVAALNGAVSLNSLVSSVQDRVPRRAVDSNIASLQQAYEMTQNVIGESS